MNLIRSIWAWYKSALLWARIAIPIVILLIVVAIAAPPKKHTVTATTTTTTTSSTTTSPTTTTLTPSSTSAVQVTNPASSSPKPPSPTTPPASSSPQAVPTTTVASTVAPPATAPPGTPAALIEVVGDEKIVINVNLLPAAGCSIHNAGNGQLLPDPLCTPGAAATRVTQANIATTICVAGYTATVRPPSSITTPLKQRTATAYGIAYDPTVQEYDHLIPLELGGANDVRNLWTEPPTSPTQKSTTNIKDGVESKLKTAVCAGRIGLIAAQVRIATDWTTALVGL